MASLAQSARALAWRAPASALALFIGVHGIAGSARADTYTFALIDALPSTTSNASSAGVNNAGLVTWRTIDGGGNTAIRWGSGGPSNVTLDAGSGAAGVTAPSINAAGHVAYRRGGVSGDEIRRHDGLASALVASAGISPFAAFGSPSLRDNDDVAFYATKDAGGSGIYVNHAGINSPIAESGPNFTAFNTEPVINLSGRVAFKADLSGGGIGVFTGDGATTTTIAAANGTTFDTLHGFNLNDAGTVVYSGFFGGQYRIQTGSGGPATLRVSASGTYQNVGNLDINNLDQIAFFAQRLSGAPGIYTGQDPATTTVIQGGDALFGTTVNDVQFFTEGLNDAGQVAFYATLAAATPLSGGSTRVVVLATPVPEPALACACAVLAACVMRRRPRRASPAATSSTDGRHDDAPNCEHE